LEEILLYAISNDLSLLQGLIDSDHDAELDAMIEMGWGNVDQNKIPSDWRTRRGPERPHPVERKLAISHGMRRRRADQCAFVTASRSA